MSPSMACMQQIAVGFYAIRVLGRRIQTQVQQLTMSAQAADDSMRWSQRWADYAAQRLTFALLAELLRQPQEVWR